MTGDEPCHERGPEGQGAAVRGHRCVRSRRGGIESARPYPLFACPTVPVGAGSGVADDDRIEVRVPCGHAENLPCDAAGEVRGGLPRCRDVSRRAANLDRRVPLHRLRQQCGCPEEEAEGRSPDAPAPPAGRSGAAGERGE